MRKNTIKYIVISVFILLFLNNIGYAEYITFKGMKRGKIEYYEIFIKNTLILRIRDKGIYETPLKRATILVEKLEQIFKNNDDVKLYDFKFNIKQKNISYKKEILVKITKKDVILNKAEYLALGLLWLNRIRIGVLNTKDYKLEHKKMGYASWYGKRFDGRKTAYGEIYNRFELTAASLKYPYNTILMLTNPENKRKIIVRINDKGPYHKNRILDLSEGSAYILGTKKEGVKKLIIQLVKLIK